MLTYMRGYVLLIGPIVISKFLEPCLVGKRIISVRRFLQYRMWSLDKDPFTPPFLGLCEVSPGSSLFSHSLRNKRTIAHSKKGLDKKAVFHMYTQIQIYTLKSYGVGSQKYGLIQSILMSIVTTT